jgi:hypothetical protein
MKPDACWFWLVFCLGCVVSANAANAQTEQRIVLGLDQSHPLFETGLALTFEAVVEDSRCPAGATCVWEGDAIVRIRIDGAGVKPSIYTLHLHGRGAREIVHGDVRIHLLSLAPLPTSDGPPRAGDYRATLVARREKR